MEMIYCKKWWFPRKKPIEILTEETARNNHLNGEDYTVVLEQDDKVSYVVEMAKIDVLDYCMFPPDSFTCILKFTLYDHFGLNKEDLFAPGWKNFLKQSLAGFRSWFFLQHYNRFDGRFKPFITEMTFTVPLAGVLHDNN